MLDKIVTDKIVTDKVVTDKIVTDKKSPESCHETLSFEGKSYPTKHPTTPTTTRLVFNNALPRANWYEYEFCQGRRRKTEHAFSDVFAI